MSALMFTVGSLDPGTIGVGAPLDPELVRHQAMAAPLIVGFIVSMLLALRVCYGLAATAVDVPFSPRFAWAYGRGNTWTIIGTLFLTFLVRAISTPAPPLLLLALPRAVPAAHT